MQIKWVAIALSDINSIAEYISQDNPESAQKVLSEIYRIVNLLKEQPNMGHPGRVTGTREIYIFGTSYIIPYRIKKDVIQILRVLHAAREWPKTFQ
jgi:toxin ParE1/3/4